MKPVKVIIETPKGSGEKYAYDKEHGLFALKKILPAGMSFPYDFGFFPDTRGGDGDPVDVLVISEFKSFPGCVMNCRIIGVLLAEQNSKKGKERNDRFFAVPVLSAVFKHIDSIKDISKEEMTNIINFFMVYNLQQGKDFTPIEMVNPSNAVKLYKKYRLR
ncbi:MAG TPA: inorganic diphosphatase [Chitinophagaceae bacterium]|jgi:inorganic pyrophosphatase|nr:inorganic diphosphatase [Chitinophagaceae bacterium]